MSLKDRAKKSVFMSIPAASMAARNARRRLLVVVCFMIFYFWLFRAVPGYDPGRGLTRHHERPKDRNTGLFLEFFADLNNTDAGGVFLITKPAFETGPRPAIDINPFRLNCCGIVDRENFIHKVKPDPRGGPV